MEWLNYHHLLYFWMVVREGTVRRASTALGLAPQTISGQLRQFEKALGEKLLVRKGKYLLPTEAGRIAFDYAEEIFGLGRELAGRLKGKSSGGRPIRLLVGVADVLPKLVVRRLLQPAFDMGKLVQVVCREDKSVEEFVAELALHKLDLVLADGPVGPGIQVRAFSHLLGECGTTFFATERLARSRRRGFPRSLDGAPCLLPGSNYALRRSLDQWLASKDLHPRVVGEFDDSGLVYVFGQDGAGIFARPTVIENEIRRRHRVHIVGRTKEVRQRFYAITVERRLDHSAVSAICESARRDLFA